MALTVLPTLCGQMAQIMGPLAVLYFCEGNVMIRTVGSVKEMQSSNFL